MSDSYVTSQATIKCSCGDKCAKLTVYPDRTVFLTEKPMANISDHVSMYNIAPFGKCHTVAYPPTGSATAANHGHLTPMPCVPSTVSEWINGKSDYIVKGKPALLKSSYCRCQWGGVITITDDGQVDTGNPDLEKQQIETEEEWNEKEQDELLKDKDALLDGIQTALDLAGFAPGVGAIPDLLNAAIYAVRGDKLNAGLSLLAAVPGIGDAAAATKILGKGVKLTKRTKNVTSISEFKKAKIQKQIDKSPNVVKLPDKGTNQVKTSRETIKNTEVARIDSYERREIKVVDGKSKTEVVKKQNSEIMDSCNISTNTPSTQMGYGHTGGRGNNLNQGSRNWDKGKERQTESIFTQQKIVVDKDKKVIELPRNKENSAYNIEEKIVEKKEELDKLKSQGLPPQFGI